MFNLLLATGLAHFCFLVSQGLKDMVEPGRVCYINYGDDYGKMVVIVDMLDINRVLIDSTDGKMPRCIYPLKRLNLTKLKVAKVGRGCRTGTLKKLNKAADVADKFKATSAAVKMDKFAKRAALNDFERFKVMVLRKQRSYNSGHLNVKPKAKAPPPQAAKKEVPPSPGKKGKGKKEKKAK